MILTTKFEIDTLVKMKYDRSPDDMLQLLEVKEIIAQACYGGVQIFYDCRAIVAKKEFKGFKKEGEFNWHIGHALSKDDLKTGWRRYREDELVPASPGEVSVLIDNKKAE